MMRPMACTDCVWIFFFSSRRRHTRLQGDWSSDVCSSDLQPRAHAERLQHFYPAFGPPGFADLAALASGLDTTFNSSWYGWFIIIPVVSISPSSHNSFSYCLSAQGEKLFELCRRHLGKPVLSASNDTFSKLFLPLYHLVDTLFQCADTDEFVHLYILFLPDTKGSIGCLIFHSGVPPTIKMKDMVSCRQVKAHAASLQGKDEQRRSTTVLLKALNHDIALLFGCAAMEKKHLAPQCIL